MRINVVDGGGRGQALGMKLAAEGHEILLSPGNPGNDDFADSTGIEPTNIQGQLQLAKRRGVEFTVVGADDPLALGIVDAFQAEGLDIFGPTQQQARIESDRGYAKHKSRQLGVPTGEYRLFTDKQFALEYADTSSWPLFVKDNELAQGKGAKRCDTIEEFSEAIDHLSKIIVEQFITGPEASLHSFCDGTTEVTIPFLVRDHKSIGEHDSGAMTGGMGTIGPLPDYNPEEVRQLGDKFAAPVATKLGYKGLLFSGLKGQKGSELNLEYNARFGDPEAQIFLSLMESNLLPVLQACMKGELSDIPKPTWQIGKAAACLVLAAQGYPDAPEKGAVIEGLEMAQRAADVKILHAGTRRQGHDILTNGGRVLNLISVAESFETALGNVYAASERIAFGGRPPLIRTDIGKSVLAQHY